MKIAITGHSAGIGQALASIYQEHGHDVVGLSRRNGYNIRSIPKVLTQIEPCDVFINNAQVGFAQTELLFAVYNAWISHPQKLIVVISTMMTQDPVTTIPGLEEYRVQKTALEHACQQLRFKRKGPRIMIVRPGAIATQPGQTVPPYADVDLWAKSLIDILNNLPAELVIPEISLGPRHDT